MRDDSGQRRSAASECLSDRAGERAVVVSEPAEDHEEVIEILHPAVDHAELDGSLELLGNHRLHGVHPQLWGRHTDEHWILAVFGRRRDRVAEADVYLERNDGLIQRGGECGPDAPVVVVLADLFGPY